MELKNLLAVGLFLLLFLFCVVYNLWQANRNYNNGQCKKCDGKLKILYKECSIGGDTLWECAKCKERVWTRGTFNLNE